MLDLRQYNCLGEALRAALDRWPDELCLIEADRDREKARFTYRQFKDAALPLARALQDAGFQNGTRAAIIMTNQSKWLISAYAIFFSGGVLVPLDYKLTPRRADSAARALEGGISCRRASRMESHHPGARFQSAELRVGSGHRGAGERRSRGGEALGRIPGRGEPAFVPRKRTDPACIVYSSGTAGRPKGCVLTHENYLEQCMAVTPIFPFWPGARYLSIIPTNHAIDFMGGFIMPFTGGGTVVHLRTLRPEFIRDAFTRYKITYMAVVPLILTNLQRGLRERFAALSPMKRRVLNALISVNGALTRRRPHLGLSRMLLKDIHQAFGGSLRALLVGGAFTEPSTIAFFHDLGIPIYNGYGCTEAVHGNHVERSEAVSAPRPSDAPFAEWKFAY